MWRLRQVDDNAKSAGLSARGGWRRGKTSARSTSAGSWSSIVSRGARKRAEQRNREEKRIEMEERTTASNAILQAAPGGCMNQDKSRPPPPCNGDCGRLEADTVPQQTEQWIKGGARWPPDLLGCATLRKDHQIQTFWEQGSLHDLAQDPRSCVEALAGVLFRVWSTTRRTHGPRRLDFVNCPSASYHTSRRHCCVFI